MNPRGLWLCLAVALVAVSLTSSSPVDIDSALRNNKHHRVRHRHNKNNRHLQKDLVGPPEDLSEVDEHLRRPGAEDGHPQDRISPKSRRRDDPGLVDHLQEAAPVEETKDLVSIPCPSCKEGVASEEELRQLRIDMIKQQILMKLRLKEPPNATLTPSSLPLPLVKGSILPRGQDTLDVNRNMDDFYGKTEQVIVFPEEKEIQCFTKSRVPAACFTFMLPREVSWEEVSTAQLWVYKFRDEKDKGNQTFVISGVRTANGDINHSATPTWHITTETYDIKEGWMKFDVAYSMRKWLERSHLHRVLQISCKTCALDRTDSPVGTEAPIRPFIVINTSAYNRKRRPPRHLECSSGTSDCCRESLVISFEEIGWDAWIVEPKQYNAYYCRGSCSTISSAVQSEAHHASILQRYLHVASTQGRTLQFTPCCTASRMAAMSMIYLDNQKNIIQKTLPDMVVQSCGCK